MISQLIVEDLGPNFANQAPYTSVSIRGVKFFLLILVKFLFVALDGGEQVSDM